MVLKDLIKKVEKANKINEELGTGEKANLVLVHRYDKPIRIYNVKDIKKITDFYIEECSNGIINNELERTEKFLYKIINTEFEIAVEF